MAGLGGAAKLALGGLAAASVAAAYYAYNEFFGEKESKGKEKDGKQSGKPETKQTVTDNKAKPGTLQRLIIPSTHKLGDLAVLYSIGPGKQQLGVIVLPECATDMDTVRLRAQILMDAGFTVMLPDLYRGQVATDPAEAGPMTEALDKLGAVDDIISACFYLKTHGCKAVGILGTGREASLALAASVLAKGDLNAGCITNLNFDDNAATAATSPSSSASLVTSPSKNPNLASSLSGSFASIEGSISGSVSSSSSQQGSGGLQQAYGYPCESKLADATKCTVPLLFQFELVQDATLKNHITVFEERLKAANVKFETGRYEGGKTPPTEMVKAVGFLKRTLS